MERIRLSKNAKRIFRLLEKGICQRPYDMNCKEFNLGAIELQMQGLIICHQEENGNVENAKITDLGKIYLSINPHLHNPIAWNYIATISLIVFLIALFVARMKL